MTKKIRKSILLISLFAGGLLIGFNAGHLSNWWNTALFVIGMILVSMSTTVLGLLKTIWKKCTEGENNENMQKNGTYN